MTPACVLRLAVLAAASALPLASPVFAQAPPLMSHAEASALAGELSGEAAKRNLEEISRHHRMRGSREFRSAADFIVQELQRAGLAGARVEEFPADGERWYGTQRARPAWDAEFAELWEVRRDGDGFLPLRRLASFDAMPMTLAQDSESGQATAELVDVGQGTSPADYEGKDVRGKLVLAAAQPGAVATLAVARHGAAGIVSYAQNQRTAWWGDDDRLVRWGHLDTFTPHKTFAFMISLREARAFQQRLARGETVLLRANVRAGQRPGAYSIVTATIPGADPALARQEVVFTCHLDHPRPGANDNASGCVTILEVARTYAKLIDEGRLPRPARTLRFIWPPEIEGTIAYLNARPEVAAQIAATIHLDMVGGGPETKAVFHVTRGPASLPSFVNDVAAAIGTFVNEQTGAFAATGDAAFPLNAPEGGKEPLRAALVDFTSGSDHQVYTEGSFRIPAVYLNDWPDRYIHTNFDTPANIDPTKLLRAGFIAAATGWVLANLGPQDAPAVLDVIRPLSLERMATLARRLPGAAEPDTLLRFQLWHERTLLESLGRFFEMDAEVRRTIEESLRRFEVLVGGAPPAPAAPAGEGAVVFSRDAEPKGPMSGFGYDYFDDKWGAERPRPRLLSARAQWGAGGYAYEALNLVDGRRTVQEIRDMLSAIYGPVPLDVVAEYLRALQTIGILSGPAAP
jgi:aminopeptidase YwaD